MSERDDASVGLRSRASETNLSVDCEREVDRRSAPRELDDLALGSEAVNLFRIEVELKGIEELARVFDLLLPFDEPFEPDEGFIFICVGAAPALLVFPVRGDSFFGNSIHVIGADLHFERLSALADYRGVERLVKILARYGDPVFETARDGLPRCMDDAQRGITVLYRFGNNANRHQVVDLIDSDALATDPLVDRVEPFDSLLEMDHAYTRLAHHFEHSLP